MTAVQQGIEAGRQGDDPRTCPYPAESLLRTAWIKGVVRGRREQHDDDATT
ncbi:Rmf/CrpP fold protein [Streptomyces sp. NRRL F-5630]|uniref:Rmf/CrpP fold protein n=1 Tax=Streptomyces sp. NRRL F-5630 TaxID=1463864 RepID=UPI003EBC559B